MLPNSCYFCFNFVVFPVSELLIDIDVNEMKTLMFISEQKFMIYNENLI